MNSFFLVYLILLFQPKELNQDADFEANKACRLRNYNPTATEHHTKEARKGIKRGLSNLELESMPGVEEGGKVKGTECAVCLDEIEEGQIARVMPQCGQVFHRGCVDLWLSKNAICPFCRNQLIVPLPPEPRVFDVV